MKNKPTTVVNSNNSSTMHFRIANNVNDISYDNNKETDVDGLGVLYVYKDIVTKRYEIGHWDDMKYNYLKRPDWNYPYNNILGYYENKMTTYNINNYEDFLYKMFYNFTRYNLDRNAMHNNGHSDDDGNDIGFLTLDIEHRSTTQQKNIKYLPMSYGDNYDRYIYNTLQEADEKCKGLNTTISDDFNNRHICNIKHHLDILKNKSLFNITQDGIYYGENDNIKDEYRDVNLTKNLLDIVYEGIVPYLYTTYRHNYYAYPFTWCMSDINTSDFTFNDKSISTRNTDIIDDNIYYGNTRNKNIYRTYGLFESHTATYNTGNDALVNGDIIPAYKTFMSIFIVWAMFNDYTHVITKDLGFSFNDGFKVFIEDEDHVLHIPAGDSFYSVICAYQLNIIKHMKKNYTPIKFERKNKNNNDRNSKEYYEVQPVAWDISLDNKFYTKALVQFKMILLYIRESFVASMRALECSYFNTFSDLIVTNASRNSSMPTMMGGKSNNFVLGTKRNLTSIQNIQFNMDYVLSKLRKMLQPFTENRTDYTWLTNDPKRISSKTSGAFDVANDFDVEDIFRNTQNSSFIDAMWVLIYGINRKNATFNKSTNHNNTIPEKTYPHWTPQSLGSKYILKPITGSGSSTYSIIDDIIYSATLYLRKQVIDNINILQLSLYFADSTKGGYNDPVVRDKILNSKGDLFVLTNWNVPANLSKYASMYKTTKAMLDEYRDVIIDLLGTASLTNINIRNLPTDSRVLPVPFSESEYYDLYLMDSIRVVNVNGSQMTKDKDIKTDFFSKMDYSRIVRHYFAKGNVLGHVISSDGNSLIQVSDTYKKFVGGLEDIMEEIKIVFNKITRYDIESYKPVKRTIRDDVRDIRNMSHEEYTQWINSKNTDPELTIFGEKNTHTLPTIYKVHDKYKELADYYKANKNNINKEQLLRIFALQSEIYTALTGSATNRTSDKYINLVKKAYLPNGDSTNILSWNKYFPAVYTITYMPKDIYPETFRQGEDYVTHISREILKDSYYKDNIYDLMDKTVDAVFNNSDNLITEIKNITINPSGGNVNQFTDIINNLILEFRKGVTKFKAEPYDGENLNEYKLNLIRVLREVVEKYHSTNEYREFGRTIHSATEINTDVAKRYLVPLDQINYKAPAKDLLDDLLNELVVYIHILDAPLPGTVIKPKLVKDSAGNFTVENITENSLLNEASFKRALREMVAADYDYYRPKSSADKPTLDSIEISNPRVKYDSPAWKYHTNTNLLSTYRNNLIHKFEDDTNIWKLDSEDNPMRTLLFEFFNRADDMKIQNLHKLNINGAYDDVKNTLKSYFDGILSTIEIPENQSKYGAIIRKLGQWMKEELEDMSNDLHDKQVNPNYKNVDLNTGLYPENLYTDAISETMIEEAFREQMTSPNGFNYELPKLKKLMDAYNSVSLVDTNLAPTINKLAKSYDNMTLNEINDAHSIFESVFVRRLSDFYKEMNKDGFITASKENSKRTIIKKIVGKNFIDYQASLEKLPDIEDYTVNHDTGALHPYLTHAANKKLVEKMYSVFNKVIDSVHRKPKPGKPKDYFTSKATPQQIREWWYKKIFTNPTLKDIEGGYGLEDDPKPMHDFPNLIEFLDSLMGYKQLDDENRPIVTREKEQFFINSNYETQYKMFYKNTIDYLMNIVKNLNAGEEYSEAYAGWLEAVAADVEVFFKNILYAKKINMIAIRLGNGNKENILGPLLDRYEPKDAFNLAFPEATVSSSDGGMTKIIHKAIDDLPLYGVTDRESIKARYVQKFAELMNAYNDLQELANVKDLDGFELSEERTRLLNKLSNIRLEKTPEETDNDIKRNLFADTHSSDDISEYYDPVFRENQFVDVYLNAIITSFNTLRDKVVERARSIEGRFDNNPKDENYFDSIFDDNFLIYLWYDKLDQYFGFRLDGVNFINAFEKKLWDTLNDNTLTDDAKNRMLYKDNYYETLSTIDNITDSMSKPNAWLEILTRDHRYMIYPFYNLNLLSEVERFTLHKRMRNKYRGKSLAPDSSVNRYPYNNALYSYFDKTFDDNNLYSDEDNNTYTEPIVLQSRSYRHPATVLPIIKIPHDRELEFSNSNIIYSEYSYSRVFGDQNFTSYIVASSRIPMDYHPNSKRWLTPPLMDPNDENKLSEENGIYNFSKLQDSILVWHKERKGVISRNWVNAIARLNSRLDKSLAKAIKTYHTFKRNTNRKLIELDPFIKREVEYSTNKYNVRGLHLYVKTTDPSYYFDKYSYGLYKSNLFDNVTPDMIYASVKEHIKHDEVVFNTNTNLSNEIIDRIKVALDSGDTIDLVNDRDNPNDNYINWWFIIYEKWFLQEFRRFTYENMNESREDVLTFKKTTFINNMRSFETLKRHTILDTYRTLSVPGRIYSATRPEGANGISAGISHPLLYYISQYGRTNLVDDVELTKDKLLRLPYCSVFTEEERSYSDNIDFELSVKKYQPAIEDITNKYLDVFERIIREFEPVIEDTSHMHDTNTYSDVVYDKVNSYTNKFEMYDKIREVFKELINDNNNHTTKPESYYQDKLNQIYNDYKTTDGEKEVYNRELHRYFDTDSPMHNHTNVTINDYDGLDPVEDLNILYNDDPKTPYNKINSALDFINMLNVATGNNVKLNITDEDIDNVRKSLVDPRYASDIDDLNHIYTEYKRRLNEDMLDDEIRPIDHHNIAYIKDIPGLKKLPTVITRDGIIYDDITDPDTGNNNKIVNNGEGLFEYSHINDVSKGKGIWVPMTKTQDQAVYVQEKYKYLEESND